MEWGKRVEERSGKEQVSGGLAEGDAEGGRGRWWQQSISHSIQWSETRPGWRYPSCRGGYRLRECHSFRATLQSRVGCTLSNSV